MDSVDFRQAVARVLRSNPAVAAAGFDHTAAQLEAGAVRFRPMLLTAAAVIVGASVMLADPIFQGLAISLMAGEIASLLLSRMTVPILFYLSERKKHAHRARFPEETAG